MPEAFEEGVGFLPAPIVAVEELDAIDIMWMERLAKPFAPTISRPIRAVRCTGTTKNGPRAGRQCGHESILGANVCVVHGAQLPVVKKAAVRRKEEIRLRLVDLGDRAVDGIEDIMEDSAQSGAVRLKAYTEVLDRIGVRGGVDVDVTVTTEMDPADLMRAKLAKLRERSAPVIDGEILHDTVDDEPEQLKLDWSTDGEL